jgi:hypothetical protein
MDGKPPDNFSGLRKADLVFDPTLAGRSIAHSTMAPTPLSRIFIRPDLRLNRTMLTRKFSRLTWTALPATGIGFQPQTRTLTEKYYMAVSKKRQVFFANIFCFRFPLQESRTSSALLRAVWQTLASSYTVW